MSSFEVPLGPRALGAEVLVHIGRQRLSGMLAWGPPTKRRHLFFHQGRPMLAYESDGQKLTDREQVIRLVRAFGATTTGRCAFDEAAAESGATQLGIDTLGEVLVCVLRTLTAAQLDTFWSARTSQAVQPTPLFDRLAPVIANLSGVRLAPPKAGMLLGRLPPDPTFAPEQSQRAWATMLILGGLESPGVVLPLSALTQSLVGATTAASVLAASGAATAAAAAGASVLSPEARRVVEDIDQAFSFSASQYH